MHTEFLPNIRPEDCALFLDFDGTLVDIAATPESITVPQNLVPLLERLHVSFAGCVCLVTGRSLQDIRRYTSPLELDVMAEHGAVSSVSGVEALQRASWPQSWHEHLLTLHQCIPDLVVETKATGVALHYRKQPELEAEVVQFAELLQRHAPQDFVVVTSNMTTEIRCAGIDKGNAIEAVMKTERYSNRIPIFIADDETDEPGFHAVEKLNGFGLHVQRNFAGKTQNVLEWLDGLTALRRAA